MPELFDILRSTRAMRRLKPDPVPDAAIRKILQAGVSAANAANAQRWRFLVVKDRAVKRAVKVHYRRAFDEIIGPHYRESAPPPGVSIEKYRRQHNAVAHLTEHFDEAPVWIVACLEEDGAPTRWSGASIYPAVQNMLLAARGLGLGATLTTRHSPLRRGKRARARPAAGRAFLCHPAHRLADGKFRPGSARTAGGSGVSRSLGRALGPAWRRWRRRKDSAMTAVGRGRASSRRIAIRRRDGADSAVAAGTAGRPAPPRPPPRHHGGRKVSESRKQWPPAADGLCCARLDSSARRTPRHERLHRRMVPYPVRKA